MSDVIRYELRIRMPSGAIEWSAGSAFTTPDPTRAARLTLDELAHTLTYVRLARKNMPDGALEAWIDQVDIGGP
jgi:hypothetical protein